MERITLGHTNDIRPEWEAEVGVPPGELREKWFSVATIRAYAVSKMGETGAPEAVEFLARLKREDFESDATGEIWSAAQVGLRVARLRGIEDPQAQVSFIEQTLESQLPDGRGSIAWWAINELCDRGILTSMANIQHSIKRNLLGKEGEDELRFCETRIRVVNRYPDRRLDYMSARM